jgi:small-conductance mechanosensitive channel
MQSTVSTSASFARACTCVHERARAHERKKQGGEERRLDIWFFLRARKKLKASYCLKELASVRMMVFGLTELLQDLFQLGQFESEIAAAVIIFALSVSVGWTVYMIFRKYFSQWAKGTKTKIDDEILRNIKAPVLLLATLLGLAQILIITFIVTRVINVLANWLAQRARAGKRVSEHILFVFKQIIKAAVYIFALIAILGAFNVDLSGVVVGLGVGGIAIALALQNVLSDVFSAFSIFFDRPFEVGDFIVIGDYAGTVKKIGVKSTRLQLLQGEELVISNRELTTTSLRNFRKLKKRRVLFMLSVAADTPVEKLRKIPTLIQGIIENVKSTEFDRAHFTEFGDFTLNFQIVYYMKTSDYNEYLDAQQTINLEIIEAFQKEGIVMPFPTQSIFVHKPTSS